jgi:signal transduction histidine kinase
VLTPKQNDYVSHVQMAAGQLMNLIDTVLEMAQMDLKASPTFCTVQANTLLESVQQALMSTAQEQNLVLSFEPTEKPLMFFAEERFLKQALIHLGLYSIRHTPMNGSVQLSVSYDKEFITFHVYDTGLPMSDAHIAIALQQPVIAGQDLTRSRRDGSSLELAFARQVVQRYQGTLSIQSRPDGVETQFKIPRSITLQHPETQGKAISLSHSN